MEEYNNLIDYLIEFGITNGYNLLDSETYGFDSALEQLATENLHEDYFIEYPQMKIVKPFIEKFHAIDTYYKTKYGISGDPDDYYSNYEVTENESDGIIQYGSDTLGLGYLLCYLGKDSPKIYKYMLFAIIDKNILSDKCITYVLDRCVVSKINTNKNYYSIRDIIFGLISGDMYKNYDCVELFHLIKQIHINVLFKNFGKYNKKLFLLCIFKILKHIIKYGNKLTINDIKMIKCIYLNEFYNELDLMFININILVAASKCEIYLSLVFGIHTNNVLKYLFDNYLNKIVEKTVRKFYDTGDIYNKSDIILKYTLCNEMIPNTSYTTVRYLLEALITEVNCRPYMSIYKQSMRDFNNHLGAPQLGPLGNDV